MKNSFLRLLVQVGALLLGAAIFVLLAEVMKWILQILIVILSIVISVWLIIRYIRGDRSGPIVIKRTTR